MSGERPRRVGLFASCIADLAVPGPALAALDVIEAMGFSVEVPSAQTCCGQVALNSGHPGDARRLLRHWIEVFSPYDAVVSPSGSCTATVHHQGPRVLEEPWRSRAAALANRSYELTQFVAAYGGGLELSLDATVTWHDSCHMARSLGERRAPRVVLGRVEGLTLREMVDPDTCCGFGGTFAVKFPELSVAMADHKLDNAAAAGGCLVSADPACLMHLRGRAEAAGRPVQTGHVAELLHDALPACRATSRSGEQAAEQVPTQASERTPEVGHGAAPV